MSARSAMQRAAAQQRQKITVEKDDDDAQKLWKGYAWEANSVKSWDQIEEDPETGRLKSFTKSKQVARKKLRDDALLTGVRRGVIRYCVIIVDMSDALRLSDYKPSRGELIVDALISFVSDFFDENPISHIALVLTRDADACTLSPFTNNLSACVRLLKNILKLGPNGLASLQNSLILANKLLANVPVYGMKEVLVCYGSLSTCDPSNIHHTIGHLASNKVKCHVLGMAAELYILKQLVTDTNGNYIVALDETHYRESLLNFVVPSPTTTKQVSASLIRMGFPMLKRLPSRMPYCNNPLTQGKLGYNCPRCSAWLSDMPCECVLCGMTLVSSPHLARSYHHLFPVPKFVSLDTIAVSDIVPTDSESHGLVNGNTRLENGNSPSNDEVVSLVSERITPLKEKEFIRCTGCSMLLKNKDDLRVLCPSCLHPFCLECDVFVHDSLHYCPGCGMEQ